VIDEISCISLLDWKTVESRACGEKTVSIEKLKSVTSFPYSQSDKTMPDRFWRVFERFTNEERELYLKFVWGRSRLPIDMREERNLHQVRVMGSMNKKGFP
jgi:E3 ubiquitin-protein ligase HERC1